MRLIEKVWFEGHKAKRWMVPLLLPFSLLFFLLSSLRRLLFKLGIKSSIKVNCPVIIVGNIGVGGNGKTPVVLFLVEQLTKQGIKVGVLSRGYGGSAPQYPYLLTDKSTAKEAGDEPALIFQRCNIPVVVGSDRIEAANKLIEQGCQIIISDDGLQHYRLRRDYELLVIDSKRLFGNGLLLPAGPLRERTNRLHSVNRIILNDVEGIESAEHTHLFESKRPISKMQLRAERVINIKTGEERTLAEFINETSKVNAIAGIGDPQRFFNYLVKLGFDINKHQGFIDHQAYNESLFAAIDSNDEKIALLMTEKDAVKCKDFAKEHWWYLPVDAVFSSKDNKEIIREILHLL